MKNNNSTHKSLKGGKEKMALEKLDQPILNKYVCERCGHTWLPRSEERPRVCPKCKSAWWDQERTEPSKDKKDEK